MVLQLHQGASNGPADQAAPRSNGEQLRTLGLFTVMLFAAGFAATAAATWLASVLG